MAGPGRFPRVGAPWAVHEAPSPDTKKPQVRSAKLATRGFVLERMTGIEPAFSAWEADVLTIELHPQCVPKDTWSMVLRSHGERHAVPHETLLPFSASRGLVRIPMCPEWQANRSRRRAALGI